MDGRIWNVMFRKCVEGSEQLTIDSREIINRSYIQAMQITNYA